MADPIKASANPFPFVTLSEQPAAPDKPLQGSRFLFVDPTGALKLIDYTGTISNVTAQLEVTGADDTLSDSFNTPTWNPSYSPTPGSLGSLPGAVLNGDGTATFRLLSGDGTQNGAITRGIQQTIKLVEIFDSVVFSITAKLRVNTALGLNPTAGARAGIMISNVVEGIWLGYGFTVESDGLHLNLETYKNQQGLTTVAPNVIDLSYTNAPDIVIPNSEWYWFQIVRLASSASVVYLQLSYSIDGVNWTILPTNIDASTIFTWPGTAGLIQAEQIGLYLNVGADGDNAFAIDADFFNVIKSTNSSLELPAPPDVTSQLPLTTPGDLLVMNGDGSLDRLPVGAAGQMLGIVANLPSWVPANSGPVGPAGPAGPAGANGADGAPGANGADGAPGAAGVGVPAGGTAGQVLAKNTNTDYDTGWADPAAGNGSGSVGPAGPQGPQGIQGPVGPAGPAGPAGSGSGGGGGGGIFDISMGVPALADFTVIDPSAISTMTEREGVAINMKLTGATPNHPNLIGLTKTAPSSSAAYSVALYIAHNNFCLNYNGIGFGWYDPVTGKLDILCASFYNQNSPNSFMGGGYEPQAYNTADSRSSGAALIGPNTFCGPSWYHLSDDGNGNVSHGTSLDGVNIINIRTISKASGWLAGVYTDIFVGYFGDGEAGNSFTGKGITMFCYDEDGLSRLIGAPPEESSDDSGGSVATPVIVQSAFFRSTGNISLPNAPAAGNILLILGVGYGGAYGCTLSDTAMFQNYAGSPASSQSGFVYNRIVKAGEAAPAIVISGFGDNTFIGFFEISGVSDINVTNLALTTGANIEVPAETQETSSLRLCAVEWDDTTLMTGLTPPGTVLYLTPGNGLNHNGGIYSVTGNTFDENTTVITNSSGGPSRPILVQVELVGVESTSSSGSSSAPATTTLNCTYVSDGDANDLMYLLGTAFGTQAWQNPQATGAVTVTTNASVQQNSLADVTDHSPAYVGLYPSNANDYVVLALTTGTLVPNYFSYQFRADDNNYTTGGIQLEGSTDGITWDNLGIYNNLTPVESAWVSNPITATKGYSRFRLTQTQSYNGSGYFYIGELQLYGAYTLPTADIPT